MATYDLAASPKAYHVKASRRPAPIPIVLDNMTKLPASPRVKECLVRRHGTHGLGWWAGVSRHAGPRRPPIPPHSSVPSVLKNGLRRSYCGTRTLMSILVHHP